MHLHSLCLYDHASSTSFCPLVAITDRIKVLYKSVEKPFSSETHWWSVRDAKHTTVHHRRDLHSLISPAQYPEVKRGNSSFAYESQAHDTVVVPDPYNWLEQPSPSSQDVKAFIEAQNAFTQQFVDQCAGLDDIRQSLRRSANRPRFSMPSSYGPKEDQSYYYLNNAGLDPQFTLYVATRKELLAAEEDAYASLPGHPFFNSSLLSVDGSLSASFEISYSGKLAAYTVGSQGEDRSTTYFRETSKPFMKRPADATVAAAGGPDRLTDVLVDVLSNSIAWTNDDQGVFYQRIANSTSDVESPAVSFHRLNTLQDQDVIVAASDVEQSNISWEPKTTQDGNWLILTLHRDSFFATSVYLAPLDQPISTRMKWLSIAPSFNYTLSYVTNIGKDFYFLTNMKAPNWKVVHVQVDPSDAKAVGHVSDLKGESVFEDVIEERSDAVLDNVFAVNNDKLLAVYSKDANTELYQYDLSTGKRMQRILPSLIASIGSINARPDTNEAFVYASSFTKPKFEYRLAWDDGKESSRSAPAVILHRSTKIAGLNVDDFDSRQDFVSSSGGIKVPVFLTYRKGTPMDGTAPAWVFFIGGERASLEPFFDIFPLSWLASYGGVYVTVGARGGSEYGEAWHDAGSLKNKRNTFQDVIATCEYLVRNFIAAKGKIIVNGDGVGGLAALAVANFAPQGLLGAVFADSPLADMLRYELFPLGAYMTDEFGDPRNPEFFDILYGYSPLHNVRADKTYPLMLLSTSDRGDRVAPIHLYKMIAELQSSLPNNESPLLARIWNVSSEGGSDTLDQNIELRSIQHCLAARTLSLVRSNS